MKLYVRHFQKFIRSSLWRVIAVNSIIFKNAWIHCLFDASLKLEAPVGTM